MLCDSMSHLLSAMRTLRKNNLNLKVIRYNLAPCFGSSLPPSLFYYPIQIQPKLEARTRFASGC